MAISVSFYNLAKAENSTKRPADQSAGLVASCLLKAPTDVMNPVIELRLASGATFPNYNYAYIPDFSRYYWITNWEWQAGFWLAYLKVDVLATYKTYLGSRTFYVLRQAAAYNSYIKDELYPMTDSCTYAAEAGVNTAWWNTGNYLTSGCYVVSVVATGLLASDPRGYTYYVMDPAGFKTFSNVLLNRDLASYDMDNLAQQIGEALSRMVVKPMEYVKSVTWYPFGIPSSLVVAGNKRTSMAVGMWVFDMSEGGNIYEMPTAYKTAFSASWTLQRHPLAATRGDYLKGDPWTEVCLSVPRIYTIPLDPNKLIMRDTLRLTLQVDMCSGEGVYMIGVNSLQDVTIIPIDSYPVRIGVDIQMSSNQVSLSEVFDPVVNMASAAGSAASGNIPGALTSAGAAIGSVTNLYAPHVTTVGSLGSFLQIAATSAMPMLYYKFNTPADEDNTHNGRPLCQNVALGAGYNKVLDGTVELSGAYLSEIQQVRAYLENGMYYE